MTSSDRSFALLLPQRLAGVWPQLPARSMRSTVRPQTSFAGLPNTDIQNFTSALAIAMRSVRLNKRDNGVKSTMPSIRTQVAPSEAAGPSLRTLDTQGAYALKGVPFGELVSAAAIKHGVDPALVAAIIKTESNFNPNAQSRAGAKGLMQLMDGTARALGVQNVFRPDENVEGGVKFLKELLGKYAGNVPLALAAYNAGPGAVDRYGGIPPFRETQSYVALVLDSWSAFGGFLSNPSQEVM